MQEKLKYNESMSHNWDHLVQPSKCKVIKKSSKHAILTLEPLDKGFSTTLANSLRRIILSFIHGIAVCAIRIDGVDHEYSMIEGVKEDVSEIILNLKSLCIKCNSSFNEKRVFIYINGKGVIKADAIEVDKELEILNPNLILLTVTKNIVFNIELIIRSGKGYVMSNEHKIDHLEKTYIRTDAIFSPVKYCSFNISDSKIGRKNEFDKLAFTITTNGTIEVEIIPGLAAKILYEQLRGFINLSKITKSNKCEEPKLHFDKNLLRKVTDLELSIRSQNCLKNDRIIYIGDLVTKSESKMLQTANFGKRSLNEIKNLLEKMNLKFDMKVHMWPPKDINQLIKKYL